MHFSFQAAPVNIIVGSHVWVEDPVAAWIDGEVFRIRGEEVHVHTTNGKTVSCTNHIRLSMILLIVYFSEQIKILQIHHSYSSYTLFI